MTFIDYISRSDMTGILYPPRFHNNVKDGITLREKYCGLMILTFGKKEIQIIFGH
jgi:hypothetical protein